uniref:Calponin-homology (CH) domain-containing protein n=1 Tax=Acrobeloides nanus TaxID=290746 RepID=A0A914CGL8_9BILA
MQESYQHPSPFIFGSPLRHVSDEHDKVQKNTFTKWVNYHLETHTSSGQVEDLYEDLRDGVYLCHLIEVLTGEYLPVNKAKVSKRVHHLSNLTNIETNLQLLREGGYEALPTTTYSHPTSALLHPSTSSSSAEALLPKKSPIPKFRTEDLVLRWAQKEISERYGIQIKDMEKSWKDGVAFNALVHRSRPDLVNMEKVKMSSPRENLEQAFELARIHLDIRPLLDVDDMLNEKPDKKSIITYVTQFIRSPAPTTRTVTRAPKRSLEHFRSLIEWITVTSADQRISTKQDDATTSDASRYYTDYEWFCEVRNQFLYRRREFEELRENQQLFAHEEWTTISNNWRRIADRLREWNLYLESDLPEALAIVTHWVSTGEQLIHSPIDVEREHATQSLKIIERMIENIEVEIFEGQGHF